MHEFNFTFLPLLILLSVSPMEFLHKSVVFCLLFLSLSTIFVASRTPFSPIDNYLINCGSVVDATLDGRNFVSDSSISGALRLSATESVSIRNDLPHEVSPQIYNTARVFRAPSKYEFEIREKGTHMVRIHIRTFRSSQLDLTKAQYHVLINDYVALSYAGAVRVNTSRPIVWEYLIWVDSEKLEISFVPVQNSDFAFVNAIEVISAPKDLISDTAKYLGSEGIEDYEGLTKAAFQVYTRVNVGGPKVTPFNDTLWRTWRPDDEHFISGEGSEKVYSGGRIYYQKGGASPEVGPDNVYNTARVIRSKNASISNANMTWAFSLQEGHQYLIRLHFCDIASVSTGLLFFNVYLNQHLAIEDFDLSYMVNWVLSSPYYVDFVVDGYGSMKDLRIMIRPSNQSIPYGVDGILNGIEIMKLSNSEGSFSGYLSAESIMKNQPNGKFGVLAPLFVVVACLLIILSVVGRRKLSAMKESTGWTKLDVEVSDLNMKDGNEQQL